jgi:hypothetical protein
MYNNWLYSNSDWNRRLRKVYKKKIPFLLWCIMLIHMPNLFLSFSLPIADPLPLSTPLFSSAFALLCSLFCVFYSHHDSWKTLPLSTPLFCFVALPLLCVLLFSHHERLFFILPLSFLLLLLCHTLSSVCFLLLSYHERTKIENVLKQVWALQVCEHTTLHKLTWTMPVLFPHSVPWQGQHW